MKIKQSKLKKIILEEIQAVSEGGAMQHWRDFAMQRILTDREASIAMGEIARYIKKNASYTYSLPQYQEILNMIEGEEGILGLLEDVESHKRNELYPGGPQRDDAVKDRLKPDDFSDLDGSEPEASSFNPGRQ